MIPPSLGIVLQEAAPKDALEQENVIQEAVQKLIMASLSRSRFFHAAVFHGGTCLRLFFRAGRYSEDLDFLLKAPDPAFPLEPHLVRIQTDLEDEGFCVANQGRDSEHSAVKKAFVKVGPRDSENGWDLPFPRDPRKMVRVKLEVDANPPTGSVFETRYLHFPSMAAVTVQDLPSGFALKCHALLCRAYAKGRDWYDFIWYVSKRIEPRMPLFANAVEQQGPWEGQGIEMTTDWLLQALRARIVEIDWREARDDVRRFLPAKDQEVLSLWDRDFFLHHVDLLREIMISQ